MGCTPSTARRREGLFFDDKDAVSVDVSEDADRPPQVRHFSFTNITCHSFDISWKATKNIDRYQVRIFPPESVHSRSLIRSLDTPAYTFEGLKSGTRYTVGVVAFDSTGKSSSCASASDSTLPLAPTDLKFPLKSISASMLRAEWEPSRGDRDFHEISIAPTNDATEKTCISELQDANHVFTNLIPGMEYTVTVVSVANDRKSDVLEGSVVTNPGHVYDLTFPYVAQNEMQLIWKPPLGHVECYSLKLESEKQDEEAVELKKIKQTSYRFNGLVTGRCYQCEIYTHAHGKTSLRKIFQQCTLPSRVTSLSVSNLSTDEATISWSRAPGDSDDYDLFLNPKDQVEGNPSPRGVVGNSYTFTGLTPGTKYTVGVVTNSKDKISERAVVAFRTEPAQCGEITFPTDQLQSTQIGVQWSPAIGHWDSYSILVMKDGGAGGAWKQEDIFETRYTFTELTPGSEYTFSITAISDGRHSASNSASCSTLPCPAAVISFPIEEITSNSIKVTWTPSGGGVDKYIIRAKGGAIHFEDEVHFDKSEYNILKLTPGTKYQISVIVISYGVESEPSIGTCMTAPACVGDLVTETITKNEIRVSWTPPAGGADQYSLRINPDEGIDCKLYPASTHETNYTFDRLVPGALYEITVLPMANSVYGSAAIVYGYTAPGDILNAYLPADEITENSVKAVWGVEGNSKRVITTLNRDIRDGNSVLVSENVIQESNHTFRGLARNERYTIRLQALGSPNLAPAGGQDSKGAVTTIVHDVRSATSTTSTPSVSTNSYSSMDNVVEGVAKSQLPAVNSTTDDETAVETGNRAAIEVKDDPADRNSAKKDVEVDSSNERKGEEERSFPASSHAVTSSKETAVDESNSYCSATEEAPVEPSSVVVDRVNEESASTITH